MKTVAIVNPASAGGNTGENWDQIQSRISRAIPGIEYHFTDVTAGSAAALTRKALENGFEKIIAVGGDGTLSEVINGFIVDDKPVNKEAVFSFIMRGRGNDFKRNFGLDDDIESSILAAAGGDIREIDLGKVTYSSASGKKGVRYFLNIASFGMSGEVDRAMNSNSAANMLGGTGAFLFATLQTLVSYQNKNVKITVDDNPVFEAPVRIGAIANGRFFGGGMEIAPQAVLNDSTFDITIVGNLNAFEVAMNTPLLYQGKHLPSDKIKHLRGKKVNADSSQPVYLDIDGEALGELPAQFEILPSIIKLQV